ncbi:hypothetical protein EH221_06030 [bacterium]|nr:MAG: hypothetical protein EH221_06030 [bacterium]
MLDSVILSIVEHMIPNMSLENRKLPQEAEEVQLLLGAILEELSTIEKDLSELARNRAFVQEITTIQDKI